MGARQLLAKLQDHGVTVTVTEQGSLRCEPKERVPRELITHIKAAKDDLVDLLSMRDDPCSHGSGTRVEWRKYKGGSHIGEFCSLCGRWIRWLRQDQDAIATVTANPSAPWLHQGPYIVRMEAPGPEDDRNSDAKLERRRKYFLRRWKGAPHANRLVDLPPDTCYFCGCEPIAKRGHAWCAICITACDQVTEERSEQRRQVLDAIHETFPGTTQMSDWDAFRHLCRRKWPDLSSQERISLGIEFADYLAALCVDLQDIARNVRILAVRERLETMRKQA